jgi:hypothetical protein
MSTNLLYHAFGIRSYEYVDTRDQDRRVNFIIRQKIQQFSMRRATSNSKAVVP